MTPALVLKSLPTPGLASIIKYSLATVNPFQAKADELKAGSWSEAASGRSKTRVQEQSPQSVAELLGMERGDGDDFLDIGANIPMASNNSWDDANDWVIFKLFTD